MSKNAWIIFTAICVIAFGALAWYSKKDAVDVSNVDTSKIQTASDQFPIGDHVFGNKDSKVMLVEYGDYQCPGCEQANGPVKAAAENVKEDIAFVFRHYPLISAHPNAKAAAAAAESAGLQGKFWEMHDILFDKQSEWSTASATERTEVFKGYAKELGLDEAKFTNDLVSDKVLLKIAADSAMGRKDGVTGTPSFMLNGKAVDQYVKDGKIVQKGTEGSIQAWSDASALENLILRPAIKEAKSE